jgi:formylglycine-generating enzyme required for sulfatase activity
MTYKNVENNKYELRTAHILFMDIVGYSKLTANEQYKLLDTLQSIVKENTSGEELVKFPTGDGMYIADFQNPAFPLELALKITPKIKAASILLRMGMHSGTVIPHWDINQRKNLTGDGIIKAQRVMDFGDEGHILASKTYADELSKVSKNYANYFHDVGDLTAKHGITIEISNIFNNKFGNQNKPKSKVNQQVDTKTLENIEAAKNDLDKRRKLLSNFDNPIECQASYILINGGQLKYSVSKHEKNKRKAYRKIGQLCFAKFPVTNRLYERFVIYIDKDNSLSDDYIKKETGCETVEDFLPRGEFGDALTKHAEEYDRKYAEEYKRKYHRKKTSKGFKDYVEALNKYGINLVQSRLKGQKAFEEKEKPVVGISQFAAMIYCFWLTELGKKMKLRKHNYQYDFVFRLPEDYEWEWAAKDNDNRKYPWGNYETSTYTCYYNRPETVPEELTGPSKVGKHPDGHTKQGLMDMGGNVWEWMNDDDPQLNKPLLRGGAWYSIASDIECDSRWVAGHAGWWDYGVGFRVVCEIKK